MKSTKSYLRSTIDLKESARIYRAEDTGVERIGRKDELDRNRESLEHVGTCKVAQDVLG